MALKRLSTDEMLQISGGWIGPDSKAREAILASEDTAHLGPRLQAAHDGLAEAAQPVAESTRLSAITEEEQQIDLRHDDIIRGTYMVFTGAAYLLGGEEGAELLSLRDTLIPEGLSSVQKSYRGEAGQAAQLASRLTPKIRAKLDGFVLGGTKGHKYPISKYVDEWVALGQNLGELEDEKGRLQAEASVDTGPSAAAVVMARNQWIRIANALVANAALSKLDAETDALVFGPMRAAEQAADRRGRPKKKNEPEE